MPIREMAGGEKSWNAASDAYKLLCLWASQFMLLNWFFHVQNLDNNPYPVYSTEWLVDSKDII